jgi:hypothetical protein
MSDVMCSRLVRNAAAFSKHRQISSFMKIRPVGAQLFHADRRTDRHEAKSLFAILRTSLQSDVIFMNDIPMCFTDIN